MNFCGCLLLASTLFFASIYCAQEWVVKLRDDQDPFNLASEIGLQYLGPLRGPLGKKHHRFHSSDQHHPTKDFLRFHRQHSVQRSKRSANFSRDFMSSDPLWSDAWYYHGPQAYVDIIPVWDQNVTGKGIVLTIIDDGVQHIHPDLSPNYLAEASWDFISNDPDPTPHDPRQSHHGTACAGTAASVRNNGVCLHGSAYEVKLGGIRLIEEPTTDAQEAEALTHALNIVDIYSCSWGSKDDGLNTSPIGTLVQEALIHGITSGRNGKGVIYVWAAGNGAEVGDNCNYDGFVNQPYTIAIGALSHTGKRAPYSEPGASLFVVSPSSGDEAFILTTTTLFSGSSGSQAECTEYFTGTSAATPLAAGIIALVLQVNPDLNWREVQHVIVESATKIDPTNPDWIRNAAGIEVNHEYGFGLINATKAVEVARSWSKSIHYYHTFVSETRVMDLPIFDNAPERPISSYIYVKEEDCFVKTIEHVQVVLKTNHPKDIDLTVTLTSPSGTPSILAQSHAYTNVPVMHWFSYDENSTKQEGNVTSMAIATFGPPMTTLSGELILVDPPQACTPLPPLNTSSEFPSKKIALIPRGGCLFYDKVLNAQDAGYDGVLIEDFPSDKPPVNMHHPGSEDWVFIPSLIISFVDGETLRSQLEKGQDSGGPLRVDVSISLIYSKTESRLFSFADWTFLSVRHWGESPVGVWTIEIFDGVPGDVGIFDSWSLKISGASEIAPPPPEDDSTSEDQTRSIILLSVLFAVVVVIGLIWWYRRRKPQRDPKKFTALEIEAGM